MKIGIITFSRAKNFGAVLQAFALYTFLKNKGYDVELIDYVTERCAVERPDFVEIRTNNSRFWGKNRLLKKLWKAIYLKQERQEHEHFFSFLRDRVNMTDAFYSVEDLNKYCPQYDIYITGSDQVWNTDFTWDHRIDLPYFLSFAADDKKKISYASSFGRDKLDEKVLGDVRKYLSRYTALSVREESAEKILRELGLTARTVLDPTFLLDTKTWYDVCSRKKNTESFLLVFLIHPNRPLLKMAKKIGQKKKIKVVLLVSSEKNRKKLHDGAIVPKVEEWLWYFKNAEYIITDSFHGTSFSIQFKRQFLVDGTVQYNTRITNILKKLDLESRILSNVDINEALNIFEKDIDYDIVDPKRELEKLDSEQWLLDKLR